MVWLVFAAFSYAGLAGFCVWQLRWALREIRASEAVRSDAHPASWDAFLRPHSRNLPSSLALYSRAVCWAPFGVTCWTLAHFVALLCLWKFPIHAVVRVAIEFLRFLVNIDLVEIGNCEKFPTCIVANHTSNLDIYMLLELTARNFRSPCGFVAKAEVLKIPFIGKISALLGCVYVNRESATDREATVGAVKRKLSAEISDHTRSTLVIFPEGTTSVGNFLLPFKQALLEFPGVTYQAARIEYSNPLASFTTTPALPHLVLLLCLGGCRVTVHWLAKSVGTGDGRNTKFLYNAILKDSHLRRAPSDANYRVHNLVHAAVRAKMSSDLSFL